MKVFYLMLALLVLIFILIGFFSALLNRKLSRWHELVVAFPLPDNVPDTKFFKYCQGQAGRISYSGRRNGFTIGFIPAGIIIKSMVAGQADLLVPWTKIRSATKYSFRSQVSAKIDIESDIPLDFFISGEALSAFETWHFTEMKTLEQFKNELLNKSSK